MKQLMSFFALDGYLYKKGKHALHWVVGLRDQTLEIMKEVHDKIGYWGQGTTFDRVKGCTSGRECSLISMEVAIFVEIEIVLE